VAKHPQTLAEYKLKRVVESLGDRLVLEITPSIVKRYQADRLIAKAAPKDHQRGGRLDAAALWRPGRSDPNQDAAREGPEAQDRAVSRQGVFRWRSRTACWSWHWSPRRGRAQPAIAKPAARSRRRARSRRLAFDLPALALALNCGMRDAEIKNLTWAQIDFSKQILTVGKAKTDAGTGRTIPLTGTLLDALVDHTRWYAARFGEPQPGWFIFPGGGRFPKDPTIPITTLKTAWTSIRKKARVSGRWHDNRHTLITELAESGAGDETIMEIAGHVSDRCSRATATSARLPNGKRWRTSSGRARKPRGAPRRSRKSRRRKSHRQCSNNCSPTNSPPISGFLGNVAPQVF